MTSMFISIDTVEKVKSFVKDITQFEGDFDLVAGKYIVDAKSIMGIFSLDLSQVVQLNIYHPTAGILAAVEKYKV